MEETARSRIVIYVGLERRQRINLMTDAELLQALQRQDPAAQALLDKKYRKRLYATAVHFLGYQDPDCEDMVQQTFMNALGAVKDLVLTASLYSWLNKICVNLCFKRIKQRRRLATTEGETLEMLSEKTAKGEHRQREEKAERRQLAGLVLDCLKELAEKCQRVVRLRDVEQKSYADIALEVKAPIGTVFSRLARCRKALRKIVEAKIKGDADRG